MIHQIIICVTNIKNGLIENKNIIINIFDIMFEHKFIIKGMALLILAVACNFVSELFGCNLQYLLTQNMYLKHFILIFIIFFSINFTSNELINPHQVLKYTLIIYTFFLLFTKMNIYFTLFILCNLIFQYYIYTHIDYHEKFPDKWDIDVIKFEYIFKVLNYINVGVILIGFILYFIKQKKFLRYKKNFNLFKFIFGIPICSRMK